MKNLNKFFDSGSKDLRKSITKVVLLCVVSVGIFSCSKDDGGDSIDYVVDAPSLMRNMSISGATLKDGAIPVPSGVHTDNIVSMPSTIIVTSNSMFAIPFQTNTTNGRKPRIVFIKLDGVNSYYQIDLDENGNPVNSRNVSDNNQGRISCTGGPSVRLEANAMQTVPSYMNEAQVYVYSPPLQSSPADISNPMYWSVQLPITFRALDVGTGDVQVSLTWDTQSDVDLWLTEPNGNVIKYSNKISSTGGQLDFDNVIEYGPENIFYNNTAPSGTYKVQVNYYSGAPQVTHYNIVVKNGSTVNNYEGTLTSGSQTNDVVTFTR